MKIFVSSVMTGFENYRDAAFAAIHSLDHVSTLTKISPEVPG